MASPYAGSRLGLYSGASPYGQTGYGGAYGGAYGAGGAYGGYGGVGGYGGGYGSMYGGSGYGGAYGGGYGGAGGYGAGGYGMAGSRFGMYGGGAYGGGMPYGAPGTPGPWGGGDPNAPPGQMAPGAPTGWQHALAALHSAMTFAGRLSFLVDENTAALHFFITALLQLFDRAGSLYGELARFVLRLLGVKRAQRQAKAAQGNGPPGTVQQQQHMQQGWQQQQHMGQHSMAGPPGWAGDAWPQQPQG